MLKKVLTTANQSQINIQSKIRIGKNLKINANAKEDKKYIATKIMLTSRIDLNRDEIRSKAKFKALEKFRR